MKILKPVHVAMNTREEPNRYKALLTWKGLVSLVFDLFFNSVLGANISRSENIFPPLKMFAPLFPKMSMIAEVGKTNSPGVDIIVFQYFEGSPRGKRKKVPLHGRPFPAMYYLTVTHYYRGVD